MLIKSSRFQSTLLLFNGKILPTFLFKTLCIFSFRLTSAWYLFGRQQVSKYHEQAKNVIHLHLCLLRLGGDLATDILISFNDPVFVRYVLFFLLSFNEKSLLNFSAQSSSNDQQTQSGSRWVLNDFEQFFRSLEIVDFGLFVPTTNNDNPQSNDIDMS